MKLVVNENKVILYLNKMYMQTLDFKNKEETEKYLKFLLNKLASRYDINFNGYYLVHIYIDMSYGVIIELTKEELEYLDYFNNQIEMNTKITHGSFLYEVHNLDDKVFTKFYVYKLKDKLYLRIKKELSDFEMAEVIENANIIYGKKADTIIRKAHLVR